MAELDKPASAAQNAIFALLDRNLQKGRPQLLMPTHPAIAKAAAAAAIELRDRELKAKLLSDEILTAFDKDFCENVFADDDMPALLDYRRAMTAAIVRAFDG